MASSKGAFGGGGAFLRAADLEALVEDQTPFAIVGVEPVRDSQFGDQTVYEIIIDGDEQTVFLPFGWSEARERDAERVAAALRQAEDGCLEPCYLHTVVTSAGQNARVIRDEPQTDAEPEPAPEPPKRAARPTQAAGRRGAAAADAGTGARKPRGRAAAKPAETDDDGIPY